MESGFFIVQFFPVDETFGFPRLVFFSGVISSIREAGPKFFGEPKFHPHGVVVGDRSSFGFEGFHVCDAIS
jgi:hypothetical protein